MLYEVITRERALAAGMNDHIAKPINVYNLFNIMAKWIALLMSNELNYIDDLMYEKLSALKITPSTES